MKHFVKEGQFWVCCLNIYTRSFIQNDMQFHRRRSTLNLFHPLVAQWNDLSQRKSKIEKKIFFILSHVSSQILQPFLSYFRPIFLNRILHRKVFANFKLNFTFISRCFWVSSFIENDFSMQCWLHQHCHHNAWL